jgi:hypothetical protein
MANYVSTFGLDASNNYAYLGDGVTTHLTMRGVNVGVSNTKPLAELDVNGSISSSDAIQVGTSSLACTAGIPGAIRYNSGVLQFCNGSSWTPIGSGTVGGTGSATAVAYLGTSSALAYDSDGLYWDATNNRLGIGTNNRRIR